MRYLEALEALHALPSSPSFRLCLPSSDELSRLQDVRSYDEQFTPVVYRRSLGDPKDAFGASLPFAAFSSHVAFLSHEGTLRALASAASLEPSALTVMGGVEALTQAGGTGVWRVWPRLSVTAVSLQAIERVITALDWLMHQSFLSDQLRPPREQWQRLLEQYMRSDGRSSPPPHSPPAQPPSVPQSPAVLALSTASPPIAVSTPSMTITHAREATSQRGPAAAIPALPDAAASLQGPPVLAATADVPAPPTPIVEGASEPPVDSTRPVTDHPPSSANSALICPAHLFASTAPLSCPHQHTTYLTALGARLQRVLPPFPLSSIPASSSTFTPYLAPTERSKHDHVLLLPFPASPAYLSILRQPRVLSILRELAFLPVTQTLVPPLSSLGNDVFVHLAATGSQASLYALVQSVVFLVEHAAVEQEGDAGERLLGKEEEWREFISSWRRLTGKVALEEHQLETAALPPPVFAAQGSQSERADDIGHDDA